MNSSNNYSLKSAHLVGQNWRRQILYFLSSFRSSVVLWVSLTELEVYLPSSWMTDQAFHLWQKTFSFMLSWWVRLHVKIDWGTPEQDTLTIMVLCCMCACVCLVVCLDRWLTTTFQMSAFEKFECPWSSILNISLVREESERLLQLDCSIGIPGVNARSKYGKWNWSIFMSIFF